VELLDGAPSLREVGGQRGRARRIEKVAYGLVSDEVAIFAEDVGADLDDVLVARRVAEEVEDLASGVLTRRGEVSSRADR